MTSGTERLATLIRAPLLSFMETNLLVPIELTLVTDTKTPKQPWAYLSTKQEVFTHPATRKAFILGNFPNQETTQM